MQGEDKPSLLELMKRHQITAHHLAHTAQLPYLTVWGIVSRKEPVSPQMALRALVAFNQMLGGKHFYSLEQVDIVIAQGGEGVRV